jgi:hypothetical protein
MEMVDVLVTCMAFGGGFGVTVAVLEGRSKAEVDLWGSRGTAAGFLVGLFLVIRCPDEL